MNGCEHRTLHGWAVTGDVQGDSNLIVNGVYTFIYIYINVCYMYTYRVFFLHSIRYIMYASIYRAAVEGHFCQQLLPQVLSSCSVRPKKIAQQFPGGPFFFSDLHTVQQQQSAPKNSRSKRFSKLFYLDESDTQQKLDVWILNFWILNPCFVGSCCIKGLPGLQCRVGSAPAQLQDRLGAEAPGDSGHRGGVG